ncbi:hypothetical protein H0H92_013516 [Tricholoma furcatifolium]|nr:hypothetical protein H0H92_013516 [Tricholoma furcatifolium]
MTGQHIPLPITKGICAIAALDRQNFIGQFYDPNDHQYKFPSNVLLLSQEADEALKDIAKMWHKLEAEFTRYQSHPEDHQVDIRNAAVEYLEELKARSQPLLKQHDLFKWYYMLPDGCYSLKYPNATPIESGFTLQKLEPFSRLLTLVEPLTSSPIQISKSLVGGNPYYYAVLPLKQRPILLDHLGPFFAVGLILEDIKNGASVVTLIDLVMRFKSFAPHVVEPHVIREFLGDLFHKALEDKNSDLLCSGNASHS